MIDELSATEQGDSVPISKLRVGEFIWHEGAFRRVLDISGCTIKMTGQHVLRSVHANTVERATRRMVLDEQRARQITPTRRRRLL